MGPNGSVESTPTAVAEAPTSPTGIDDSRFSGSVAYSIDDPPAGEVLSNGEQPAEEKPGQPRNDKGQFAPKSDGTEVKPVKLPESIKLPKPHDEKDINGRFHDLSRSHEELRRELRQAREELQQLRAPRTAEPAKQEPIPKPASKLNPEDFQTYDEYMQATVAEAIKGEQAKRDAESKQQQEARYYQEKRAEFENHAQAIVQAVPDFWEVISSPQVPMTNPMAHAVIELGEMGPVTALYLASKPDEAFSIAKMAPLQASIAIGKIAARLEQEFKQANSDPEQSNTLPSPRPRAVPDVRGSSPGELDDQPNEKDSTEEWLKKETLRMRKANPTAKFWSRF